MRRSLTVLCLLLFSIVLFLSYHFSSNAPVTAEEVYRPDETAQTTRAVANFIDVVERNKTTYAARGAHSKGHACVKAYFEIIPNIKPELQHGIFAVAGHRYQSWIRFSNGASSVKNSSDQNKDARGMAIKIINIDEIIESTEATTTQEFLMHDAPVFFTANIEDYNRFVESENKILYFVSDINPFKWKLRELKHGLATLKKPPASPLWARYFSNTAYKLGHHNIKFSARSCAIPKTDFEPNQTDPNFLRNNLIEELKASSACFDFQVQLQKLDQQMPIEDPSIEWQEADSPYITVAKIQIPRQTIDTPAQQAFCENLSFSPWHSLAAHRPIGELNRIRKAVYEASSKYRHHENKTTVPDDLNW